MTFFLSVFLSFKSISEPLIECQPCTQILTGVMVWCSVSCSPKEVQGGTALPPWTPRLTGEGWGVPLGEGPKEKVSSEQRMAVSKALNRHQPVGRRKCVRRAKWALERMGGGNYQWPDLASILGPFKKIGKCFIFLLILSIFTSCVLRLSARPIHI